MPGKPFHEKEVEGLQPARVQAKSSIKKKWRDTASWASRWERGEKDVVRNGFRVNVYGVGVTNTGYNDGVTTVTGEQDKFQVCSKLSATTLNLEVDSGSTAAESGAWVCLEFARGCCLKGHECTALHRVPTVDECKAFAVDAHHDVFGRDRRPADIPSYMPDEESRTLYIGELRGEQEELGLRLRKYFGQFGKLSGTTLDAHRAAPVAVIKYKYRASNEFAREVSTGQGQPLVPYSDDVVMEVSRDPSLLVPVPVAAEEPRQAPAPAAAASPKPKKRKHSQSAYVGQAGGRAAKAGKAAAAAAAAGGVRPRPTALKGKPGMCRKFAAQGACEQGAACIFAHSEEELRAWGGIATEQRGTKKQSAQPPKPAGPRPPHKPGLVVRTDKATGQMYYFNPTLNMRMGIAKPEKQQEAKKDTQTAGGGGLALGGYGTSSSDDDE